MIYSRGVTATRMVRTAMSMTSRDGSPTVVPPPDRSAAHPYDWSVSQDPDNGFADYLRAAIAAAGFDNPTQFARKANADPSVVFAWLRGDRRPTIRSIERFAPVLGLRIETVVAAAYPEATNTTVAPLARRPLHPLAAEVDRLLGDESPLTDEERQRVTVVVETAVHPYRTKGRRKRAG